MRHHYEYVVDKIGEERIALNRQNAYDSILSTAQSQLLDLYDKDDLTKLIFCLFFGHLADRGMVLSWELSANLQKTPGALDELCGFLDLN